MTASRAILYCTVNGVCNNTNGLGRQTKTLLSALARHREELIRSVGPFDVHLACPQPGPDTWAFDPADLASSQRVVASWGGLLHATSSADNHLREPHVHVDHQYVAIADSIDAVQSPAHPFRWVSVDEMDGLRMFEDTRLLARGLFPIIADLAAGSPDVTGVFSSFGGSVG